MFLSPFMLALLPIVVGGLWYAYKRMGQARKLTVGTSFYLKKLRGTSSSRRRFIPPWRFLIELVSLLLLTLAAAGIVFKRDSKRILFILDDSRSMGAVIEGESLMQLAAQRISSDLDAESLSTPSLIKTSEPERVLTAVALKKALNDLRAIDVEDGIEGLISREAPNFDEVRVYTDKELAAGGAFFAPALFSRERAPQNVGIVGAVQAGNSLKVSLFRTGSGAETVKVTLKKYTNGLWQDAASRSVRLIDSAEAAFNLSDESPVEVSLSAPFGSNAISADDRAWIIPESSKVFRVHGELSLDALKIEGFQFVKASSLTQGNYNDIFYKLDGAASGNGLFILAPGTVKQDAAIAKGALSKWRADSPLLKYLFSADLSDVPYLPLSLPIEVEVLAGGAGGVMLGATNGRVRRVYSGVDLFPYNSNNVARSIVTLNILNWLSEAQEETQNGAILKSTESYFSLAGDKIVEPINAGLYRVKSQGSERLASVNLFSAAESQIGIKSSVVTTSAKALKPAGGFEAWRYIVYLVLALAGFDLLFSIVRRTRA